MDLDSYMACIVHVNGICGCDDLHKIAVEPLFLSELLNGCLFLWLQ